MMSVQPFRPQTPISLPSAAEFSSPEYSSPEVEVQVPISLPCAAECSSPEYSSPQVEVQVSISQGYQEKSSSAEPQIEAVPESDQSDVMSMDEEEYNNATETSIEAHPSVEVSEAGDDNLQRTIDAYNHICQHVLSVAEAIARKYKHGHIIHFSATVLDQLYNVIINWKKPPSQHLNVAMRRRVAYFASPEDLLASMISAFLLLHVLTTRIVEDLDFTPLELTWDTWLDFETPIENTADRLADQLATDLIHHIFWNVQDDMDHVHIPDHDFIAGISAGLVREALVFGLCTGCRDEHYSFPAAGCRFEPRTMRPVEREIERTNDRACLLTLFPGVNLPTDDDEGMLLEAIVVLEDEATHWI